MTIPFSVEQFFSVFARYNESVWPMQVILFLLALASIALLYRPGALQTRIVPAIFGFLWAWMAIAYHFTFFSAINPAAWLFGAVFLAGALWFVWLGTIKGKLHFRLRGGVRGWAGGSLVGYSLLVYPLLGHVLGEHYPAVPTFGLPCPTTIFTIGMLLFLIAPVPKSVFIVPLAWAAVGSLAAFKLGVVQDFGLLVAGLFGITAVILATRRDQHS